MEYLKFYQNNKNTDIGLWSKNIYKVNEDNRVGIDYGASYLDVQYNFSSEHPQICSQEFLNKCSKIYYGGDFVNKDYFPIVDGFACMTAELHKGDNYVSFYGYGISIEPSDFADNISELVTYDNSVSSINLCGNSGISFVVIESKNTTLSDYAFSGCTNLGDIIINTRTTLGEGVFKDCTNLYRVGLTDDMTIIPKETFKNCSNISVFYQSGLTNIEYIGDSAFEGCNSIPLLSSGTTKLTHIGENAFKDCYNLNTLFKLPQFSLKSLPSSGFGVNNIETLILNSVITDLPNQCLSNLSGLTFLWFPEGVKKISVGAFDNDVNLSNIRIDGTPLFDDSVYSATTNLPNAGNLTCNADVYEAFSSYLPSGWCKEIILEYIDGTKERKVFTNSTTFTNNTDIKKVVFCPGVTQIAANAFKGCSNLQEIVYKGQNLKTIGSDAFNGIAQHGIYSYDHEDSVTDISSVLPTTWRPHFSYYKLNGTIDDFYDGEVPSVFTDYYKVVVTDGVTTIPQGFIKDAVNLKTVEFGKHVASIESNSFNNVNVEHGKLSALTIPKSVTTIEDDWMIGCSSISSLTFEGKLSTIPSNLLDDTRLSEFTITADTISSSAFTDIILDKLTLNGISEFGEDCIITSLISEIHLQNGSSTPIFNGNVISDETEGTIYFDDNNDVYRDIFQHVSDGWKPKAKIKMVGQSEEILVNAIYDYEHDKYILDEVIDDKNGITSIEITDGVDIIGENIFSDCTALTSLTLPYSVKEIGTSAFENCTALSSITYRDETVAIQIDDYAFRGCTSLTETPKCSNIANGAFADCANLKSCKLVHDNNGVSIADNAFKNCYKLQTIYDDDVKLNDGKIYLYHVSHIGETAFKNCSGITDVVIDTNTHYTPTDATIYDGAFENCVNLETIQMSFSKLNANVFKNCSKLKSFPYWNNITNIIESGACENCSALEFGTVLGTISEIKDNAFKNCSSITRIPTLYPISGIGSHAFDGCSNLETISINSNFQNMTIGDYAFKDCEKLHFVILPNAQSFNTPITISEHTFANVSDFGAIVFPSYGASMEIYDTWYQYLPNNWSSSTDIVDFVTTSGVYGKKMATSGIVNSDMFQDNTVLYETIVLNNGITAIENEAFKNLSNVSSITISSSVTFVGQNVFDGCENLEELHCERLVTAPNISLNKFRNVKPNGTFYYNGDSSFNLWLKQLPKTWVQTVVS